MVLKYICVIFPSIGLDNVLVWPLRLTSNLAHYLVAPFEYLFSPLYFWVYNIIFFFLLLLKYDFIQQTNQEQQKQYNPR